MQLMTNTGNVRTFLSREILEKYSFYIFLAKSWNKVLLF